MIPLISCLGQTICLELMEQSENSTRLNMAKDLERPLQITQLLVTDIIRWFKSSAGPMQG